MKYALLILSFGFSVQASALTYFNCSNDEYSLSGSYEQQNQPVEFTLWKNSNVIEKGELTSTSRERYNSSTESTDVIIADLSTHNFLLIRLPGVESVPKGPTLGTGEVNVGGSNGRFFASDVVCTVTGY